MHADAVAGVNFKAVCFVMHMNICVEKHSHSHNSQQTRPHLSTVCYSERAADFRLTDIYQPCENTVNTHGPLVCMLRGEPGRLALLHACLCWGGAVKGVAALK